METARELICRNVAIGFSADRLEDVADGIAKLVAHYCLVLSDIDRAFIGIIRLEDLAARTHAGNRILADLVSAVRSVVVADTETAVAVVRLFEQHQLREAIVMTADGDCLGLITSESVLGWLLRHMRQNPSWLTETAADTPELSSQNRLGTRASTTGAARRVPRILLVEDHVPSRTTLANLLKRKNYQVVEASSFSSALATAAEHDFEMVISDIGLPDGTGYQLMAELKKRFGLPGIAMSGYGAAHDLARSHAAGFNLHLTKPLGMPVLESAILKVLSQKASEAL